MGNIRRIHPGEHLKRSLEAMEMTGKEFAFRTGISERTISAIINGNGDITFDVAYKLAAYFDQSVNYWMNLQTNYNVYLTKIKNEELIKEERKLYKNIIPYLIELKLIDTSLGEEDSINYCRKLVGVNNLTLLTKKDSFVCLKEQQVKGEINCFYQNFWIALALNLGRKQELNIFDSKLLKQYISEIRSMTLLDFKVFYPRLKKILNECGIAFVLLPYLSKSNIYGATKWINKDNVMLAMSNRGKKADLFWFTLFHELSHVLMQHKREMLLSVSEIEDEEANKMASDMLIPKKLWDTFILINDYSIPAIKEFADRVGIHPSIVVGRLHKENIIPYNKLNNVFSLEY